MKMFNQTIVSINTVYLKFSNTVSKFISFKKKNNFKVASIANKKNERRSSSLKNETGKKANAFSAVKLKLTEELPINLLATPRSPRVTQPITHSLTHSLTHLHAGFLIPAFLHSERRKKKYFSERRISGYSK